MPAVIIQATVNVFHDDANNTGGCRVVFGIDISGSVVNVSYDQDGIHLTTQQKSNIDAILTAIKNAAVVQVKTDMANVVLSATASQA